MVFFFFWIWSIKRLLLDILHICIQGWPITIISQKSSFQFNRASPSIMSQRNVIDRSTNINEKYGTMYITAMNLIHFVPIRKKYDAMIWYMTSFFRKKIWQFEKPSCCRCYVNLETNNALTYLVFFISELNILWNVLIVINRDILKFQSIYVQPNSFGLGTPRQVCDPGALCHRNVRL